MTKSLYEMLSEYGKSDVYPFHMPGHKRQMEQFPQKGYYEIDITEIEGFDNLHHPEGILKQAQERAASLYGSNHTYFLVNGSTCGILSAISAALPSSGKILLARNCHKAAYHAVLLRQLEVVYLEPEEAKDYSVYGGISPNEVETALKEDTEIDAIMITSPTMDGIVSDVEKITKICHNYGKPIIIDEAHGAHFGMNPDFPVNSVSYQADIVIHSVHKTLPSLTQTALLHYNGNLIEKSRIEQYLSIYQTSSPSYLLMGSIDKSVSIMHNKANTLFASLKNNLDFFWNEIKELHHIRVMGKTIIGQHDIKDIDPGKLVISVKDTNMTGQELYDMLRDRFSLQMEMAALDYVLAIVTVMDTQKGLERLAKALVEIDQELYLTENVSVIENRNKKHDIYMSIHEADRREKQAICIEQSANHICGEFVYLYPPGIPILVPGETITEIIRDQILTYKKQGLSLQGLADMRADKISIII